MYILGGFVLIFVIPRQKRGALKGGIVSLTTDNLKSPGNLKSVRNIYSSIQTIYSGLEGLTNKVWYDKHILLGIFKLGS